MPVAATIIADPIMRMDKYLDNLRRLADKARRAAIYMAIVNVLSYALDKLAYDAAVFVASGGDADGTLFDNRPIVEYFVDFGASVAGEALGQIDEFGLLGAFSLCNPDASFELALKLGIKGVFEPPTPKCDWNAIKDNWTGFVSNIEAFAASPFEKNSLIIASLADMYNPANNELSIGIAVTSSILTKAQNDALLAAQKNIFTGGFKDKTGIITGKVLTPAAKIDDDMMKRKSDSSAIRNELIIGAMADGELFAQVGLHTASVFVNTLISKGTETLSGMFSDFLQKDINPFEDYAYPSSNNAANAREFYQSFLSARPLTLQNFSLLGDFGACPFNSRGLYNCVADTSLISAVARGDGGAGMTIQEAMDDGLLNKSWALIPASDMARNQDPFCYSYGYCHGNLVKLRKARIISTGWELAAESSANSESSPITLEEVVAGFYVCNDQNELDTNHPWCHLIDPNWILKYPETQCKINMYGQLLLSGVADERQEECVDMPSCIQQDSNGNCTGGYGYCTREANVWDFRGDSCPDYYASCLTYQDPDDNEVNYLSNTTDKGICTADSTGCLWYNTQKAGTTDDDGVTTYDWPDYTTATLFADAEAFDPGEPASEALYRNRMYLTSAVATCEVEDAGCKELVSRKSGNTLNMVTNPSFEDDANADSLPDGWLMTGSTSQYSTDNSQPLSGTDAVNPGDSLIYQPGIVLTQGAEYTFSLYAKQVTTDGTTGSDTTSALIALATDDDSIIDFSGFALSGDCSIYSTDKSILEITGTPTGTIYDRYSCTFTVPTLSSPSIEVTAIINLTAGDIWYDDIQLEQEPFASDSHAGYSDTLDLAYVKVAPTYLGCTGESTDVADCANYAGVCNNVDVGCSAYTPSNGDPLVNGIVGSLDICPSACVGYDTYKQEATLYEPDGNFPVYFIPDSATECSAQSVGCDEFTNLSDETTATFTYLRACLTNTQAALNTATSDGAAVFYTWEGSDTAGYQLKTWNLLESNMAVTANYTYLDPDGASIGTDSYPELAPCSNWTTSDTGITCADTSLLLDVDTADCGQHDDIITNPDCREFYDTDGNIHYRPWSKAVTVNDDCVTYRKTDIVGADATTQTANCTNSGGFYDDTSASCRYYGYALESYTCPAKEAGCREYTGGRSRNSRQAFIEYFEDGTLTNWETDDASFVTLSKESIAVDGHSLLSSGNVVWTHVGTNSTACADDAGCDTAIGKLGGTCTVSKDGTSCGTLSDDLFSGRTYFVSFWAKGTATISVGFDTAVDTTTVANAVIDASFTATAGIALGAGWKQYSLGPLNMTAAAYPNFGNGTSALVFTPAGSATTFYLDNINIREGEDNINIIKDSWVTPAECDQTQEGGDSPQYMLGCQEYTDQNAEVSNLKSFSSLCSASKVGCAAYFQTQESDSTGAAVYGVQCNTLDDAPAITATSCYYTQTAGSFDTTSPYLCTIGVGQIDCDFDLAWYVPDADLPSHLTYSASTVISPADKDIFLVVNDDVECTSDVAGCMEVGLPTFSQDHTAVASWTSTYLMNAPADYSSILCSTKELFCNAYTDNKATTHYFKNPQDQTCEYRSGVTIGTTTFSGWFKTGLDPDELCDPEYVIGGDVGGLHMNGDIGYDNWVATCTSEYDTCTNFQDLADLEGDELYGVADGKSYHYLNNTSLEENSLPESQKCNGLVSQKAGCALFNDTSNPDKTHNESATYMASINSAILFGGSPNALVSPIDCTSSSTSEITSPDGLTTTDLCANRCQYSATDFYDINDASADAAGAYIYDGSCYTSADCRPLASETGEAVKGTCNVAGDTSTDAPRLTNDANTVLKVDRNRQCSEWLSCSDSQTVWDERGGSYKTICGNVGLCTEYSGTGDASFCSAWKTSTAAVVLNTTNYASRDTSWYGDDYSGLSIPELLPVDRLTQVNTAPPFVCHYINAFGVHYYGDACSSVDDTSCDSGGTCMPNTTTDYRLAYIAGACALKADGDPAAFESACTIGYCANTGSPCNSTLACDVEGGDCVVGTCYEVTTTACSDDANCTSPQTCLSGFCATKEEDTTIEVYNADSTPCGASPDTFYSSVNFKTGTCMENQCVLTPSGATFDTATSEAKICRGYPEQNSPFNSAVVTAWYDDNIDVTEADPSTSNKDAKPYAFVQNFSAVKTCVFGEDCECSYKKFTYGDSGTIRYFSADTDYDLDNKICTGGETSKLGSSCEDEDDDYCDSSFGGDGVCTAATKVDDAMGLDGYCLERDSSINILGDRDLNACLSWLPVDQLAGSTDLYGKFDEAGYFEETNYCSYVSPYATVYTGWGCIERVATICSSECHDESIESCLNAVTTCPVGFQMVVGPYPGAWLDNNDDDPSYAGTNGSDATFADDGGNYTCTLDLRPNCPFMCVPENSHDGDGKDCMQIIKDNDYAYDKSDLNPPDTFNLKRWWVNSATQYMSLFDELKDCYTSGVEYKEYTLETSYDASGRMGIYGILMPTLEANSWGYMPTEYNLWYNYPASPGSYAGWFDYNGYRRARPYLGCRELTQVANGDSTDGSAAWTDVLKNTNQQNNSSLMTLGLLDSSYTSFGYYNATSSTPFGASTSISTVHDDPDGDISPPYINQCRTSEGADASIDKNSWEYLITNADGTPTATGDGLSCPTHFGPVGDINKANAGFYSSIDGNYQYSTSRYSEGVGGARRSSLHVYGPDYLNIDSNNEGSHKILNRIFAKSLDIYRFEGGIFKDNGGPRDSIDSNSDGKFILEGENDPDGVDVIVSSSSWDDRALYGKPPYIYAVNMDKCDDNDNCEEDKDHPLTLNNQNDGDVVGSGFYRAYLKFYAGADKNQLPLRRIIVDWGDGSIPSGSTSSNNFYKNHRGLQPGTETSICDTDINTDDYEWGKESVNSCDPNYFSLTHIYTCRLSTITNTCADTDGDGIYDNAPCKEGADATACVFRPKVHVRDNWGWCGGVCDSTNSIHHPDNSSEGCYAGNDYTLSTNSSEPGSECSYVEYPNADDMPGVDPWVYYDGIITVTP